MAEKTQRIFPTSKPTTTATTTTVTAKPQLYNAPLPVYRSCPRHNRRSCYCYLCLWIMFIILLILIVSAIILAMLFLMYHPHRPTFSVSSIKISQFDHTSSHQLSTKLNVTFVAINSNSNTVFNYGQVSVLVSSKGVDIGDDLIPAFLMDKKSKKSLNVELKSDLNEKKNLSLKIVMNGKVNVKMGRYKSKKVNVRVVCDQIKVVVDSGEVATSENTKCKVDFRIKIWKWSI